MEQQVTEEELLDMARRCNELSVIESLCVDMRSAAMHTAESIATFLETLTDQDKTAMENAINTMTDLMKEI
jgi:hypothetical protein